MTTSKKIRCANVKNGIIKYIPEHLTKDKAFMDKMNLVVQDPESIKDKVQDAKQEEVKEVTEPITDTETKEDSIQDTSIDEVENTEEKPKRKKRKKD